MEAKNTKTVKFLTKHLGEFYYTPKSIIAVYDPENAPDMNQTVLCCSFDDWYHFTEVPLYGTVEIELPDWLEPKMYLAWETNFNRLWNNGISKDAPQEVQEALLKLSEFEIETCAILLNTRTFRSAFRQSLRDQLVSWINTPKENRKYESPFSNKQWLCANPKPSRRY